MASEEVPDIELLERWRAGDRQAGNVLLRRHFPGVRAYFVNKLPDEHEDLVQETFARLVGARDQFRQEASFRTYLFRIARYVLAEHLRKRYRRGREVEPTSEPIAYLTDRRPSSVIAERETHRLLLDALRQVSIDDQDLLELYYWQDLTAREVGSLFSLVESTVRSRIRAALERLRRVYVELGDAPHSRDLELDELEGWLQELRSMIGRARTHQPG
ncbi:MAG TPA: sigma-70 family RNA polymerase sigma factor [Enhygromyxa sp.]|nr:sigma-70 family RNA polymerase sigma factor [Enhygromyxa sp.]